MIFPFVPMRLNRNFPVLPLRTTNFALAIGGSPLGVALVLPLLHRRPGTTGLKGWSSMRSHFSRRLVVVTALALAVRVLYVLLVMRHRALGFDSNWYHDMANNLSRGRGYEVRCVVTSCDFHPTAYFPPLFPLLLAVPARLGASSLTSLQLFACGLGSCTVVAVGLLARRLGGPSVGLVAAGIAAVHPIFFAADGGLM